VVHQQECSDEGAADLSDADGVRREEKKRIVECRVGSMKRWTQIWPILTLRYIEGSFSLKRLTIFSQN
jgi:hypothetical protein